MAIKFESAFGEDLLTLAKENYQTASKLCGACRSYHSIQPYLRIADAVFDVDEQELFQTALVNVAETGSARKWLVAGSAGTGLCAALRRALQDAGVTAPQVTIADRCETPLVSCQRFARAERFKIETWQVDLLQLESANRFDAVIVHDLLPFFDEDERKLLFTNLGRCLRPGGYLINWSRYYVPEHAGGDRVGNGSERVEKIINALADGRVDLPDTKASFEHQLNDYVSGSRQRTPNLKPPDELAPLLAGAGLQVVENQKVFVDAAGRPRGYDRTTCYSVTVAQKKM